MPKAISIPPEPEFDSGLVVPAPGDGASSAVIEAALQQLLNNDGFLNQLAGAVANNLASHIATTNPHQATPNPTGDRLVLRDAEGRAAFGAPNAANHAARLADVAAAINGLPAVVRDPSAWSGLAGALLQVNEEEDGLEAAHISQIALNVESYEPSLLGASGSPAVTYHTRYGRFVRLGLLMFLELKLGWNALSGGSGQARISLPPGVTGLADQSSHLPISLLRNVTLPAGTTAVSLGGYNLGLLASRGGLAEANVNVNELGSNATIWASGWVRLA